MLRTSKPDIKPQAPQEEVRELSQISIQSNVASKTRLQENPSTHYESVTSAQLTQDYSKKSKHFSSDESASDRLLLRERVPKRISSSKDKDREKSKNKRTSPHYKPNEPTPRILMGDRCEQLMEKMKELERQAEKRQQRFSKAIQEIRLDLSVKEQRSQNLRNDLDEARKDLLERKKDINQLIQVVKDMAIGHLSDANYKVMARYPSEQSQEAVKSDREKPKKTSNEKPGKKVNSPGKKIGPQLKERSPTGRLIGKN